MDITMTPEGREDGGAAAPVSPESQVSEQTSGQLNQHAGGDAGQASGGGGVHPSSAAAPAEPVVVAEPAAPADGDVSEIVSQNKATLAAQQAEMEAMRAEARNNYLDRLGVLDRYRAMAPNVNPFTSEGKAELERFAKDHPEICVERSPRLPQFNIDDDKFAKLNSPFLVNREVYEQRLRSVKG